MEISQWQNGNYSTVCVMLAWHLYCYWLCPCEEQSIDLWPKGKKKSLALKIAFGFTPLQLDLFI